MEKGYYTGFEILGLYPNFIKISYDVACIIIDRFCRKNKLSWNLTENKYGFGYILSIRRLGRRINMFLYQPIERIYLNETLRKVKEIYF